jgi:hypothetical protein
MSTVEFEAKREGIEGRQRQRVRMRQGVRGVRALASASCTCRVGGARAAPRGRKADSGPQACCHYSRASKFSRAVLCIAMRSGTLRLLLWGCALVLVLLVSVCRT